MKNDSLIYKPVSKEDVTKIGVGKLVFISDLCEICGDFDQSYLFGAKRVPALTIPVLTDYRPDRVFAAIFVDDRTVPYFFNVHEKQMEQYGISWLLEIEV